MAKRAGVRTWPLPIQADGRRYSDPDRYSEPQQPGGPGPVWNFADQATLQATAGIQSRIVVASWPRALTASATGLPSGASFGVEASGNAVLTLESAAAAGSSAIELFLSDTVAAAIPSFTVRPSGAGAEIPYLAGLALADGAAPPASELVITSGQCKVQTRWPSGCPKHVVICGKVAGESIITPQVGTPPAGVVNGAARIAQVTGMTVSIQAYRPITDHKTCVSVSTANADGTLPAGATVTVDNAWPWPPAQGQFYAILESGTGRYTAPYTRNQHSLHDCTFYSANALQLTNQTPQARPQTLVTSSSSGRVWAAQASDNLSADLRDATLAETFWTGPFASYYRYVSMLPGQYRIWWYVLVLADGQIEVEPVLIKGNASQAPVSQMDYLIGGFAGNQLMQRTLYFHGDWPGSGTAIFHGEGLHLGSRVFPLDKPQCAILHNTVALRASKLVPNYGLEPHTNDAWDVQNASGIANMITGNSKLRPYEPGVLAGWDDDHGQGGYRDDIAPLPRHDALYITSGADERSWWAVRSGSQGKRNLPSWFLDNATGDFPNWTESLWATTGYYTQTAGIGYYRNASDNRSRYQPYGPYQVPIDVDHMPAPGYLPYLITGRRFHLDQLHAETSTACAHMDAAHRTAQVLQVGVWAQERGYAWWMRNWGLLADALPDTHPRKAYARQIVVNNIAMKVDAFPEPDPIGITPAFQPYAWRYVGIPSSDAPITQYNFVPWQQAYTACVLGWLWDLQLITNPADRTKHQQLRDTYYRGMIGLLGNDDGTGTNGYDVRAAPKFIAVGMTNEGDAALPLRTVAGSTSGLSPVPQRFNSWTQVWQKDAPFYNLTQNGQDFAVGVPPFVDTNGYQLAVDPGYASQLLPGIAYAVDHGHAGALAGYQRIIARPSWLALLDGRTTGARAPYADVYDAPNWSIWPRT